MWLEVSGGEAGLLPARAGAGGMQQQTAWRDCGGARTSNWSRLQVPLKRCSSSCCSEASFLLAWELYDPCKCFTGSLSLRESVNSALKEGRGKAVVWEESEHWPASCSRGGDALLVCLVNSGFSAPGFQIASLLRNRHGSGQVYGCPQILNRTEEVSSTSVI